MNGVGRDELPDSDDIMVDGDVVAVGGGRGPSGGWWSTIPAVRVTDEVRRRVAAEPPGSV